MHSLPALFPLHRIYFLTSSPSACAQSWCAWMAERRTVHEGDARRRAREGAVRGTANNNNNYYYFK